MQPWEQWDSPERRHSREQDGQEEVRWLGEGCYKQWCCQEPILRAGRKSGVEMVSMGGSLVWVDPTCESWHERLAGLLRPHPWWASTSVLLMIPDGLRQSAVLCVSASEREAVRKCLHGLFTPLCPSFGHHVVEHLSLLAHTHGAKVRALCGEVGESGLC